MNYFIPVGVAVEKEWGIHERNFMLISFEPKARRQCAKNIYGDNHFFCNKKWDFLGNNSGGVTPVPIPNTEVKPSDADGTALVTVWESRKSPGYKV